MATSKQAGTVKGLRLSSADSTCFHVAGVVISASAPIEVPLANFSAADLDWMKAQPRLQMTDIDMPAPDAAADTSAA